MKRSFMVVAFLCFALPMFSADSPCKGNPKLVGACYVVHGRAFIAMGTPADRIWLVGTKRILGITASGMADDAEAPIAPRNLLRAFHVNPNNPYGNFVFGDFEVCPFTPERKGEMQMVCVEKAEHLVARHMVRVADHNEREIAFAPFTTMPVFSISIVTITS